MFYKIALKSNRKVFFLNNDDKEYFLCNHILKDQQVIVLNGEGVDIIHYNVVELPKKIVFIYLGRLIKDKGILEYFNAARILKNKYPDVTFELAGDIDNHPSSITKSELNALCNEGIINYIGYVSDVKLAIKKSSVFILPSHREGTPVSILEAMAMGRPIITTDAPGCRETTMDGVNGYLVPVKDTPALVLAMEKFILSSDLILKMGIESRKIVEYKYDINKVNDIILKAMNIPY